MAYRYGNRNQLTLLPKSIEDYISKEDPVRAYDAFVDAFDLGKGRCTSGTIYCCYLF